jgi:hypothetical protein
VRFVCALRESAGKRCESATPATQLASEFNTLGNFTKSALTRAANPMLYGGWHRRIVLSSLMLASEVCNPCLLGQLWTRLALCEQHPCCVKHFSATQTF